MGMYVIFILFRDETCIKGSVAAPLYPWNNLLVKISSRRDTLTLLCVSPQTIVLCCSLAVTTGTHHHLGRRLVNTTGYPTLCVYYYHQSISANILPHRKQNYSPQHKRNVAKCQRKPHHSASAGRQAPCPALPHRRGTIPSPPCSDGRSIIADAGIRSSTTRQTSTMTMSTSSTTLQLPRCTKMPSSMKAARRSHLPVHWRPPLVVRPAVLLKVCRPTLPLSDLQTSVSSMSHHLPRMSGGAP